MNATNPLYMATEEVIREVALILEPFTEQMEQPGHHNHEKPPSPVTAPLDEPDHQETGVNILARVIHDYEATFPEEITIKGGDFVNIKSFSSDIYGCVGTGEPNTGGWCYGYVLNKPTITYGNFPKNFVEEVDENTMINITDTEFVPEGFHENCRDENGAVKITEENYHLYQDVGHLVRIYEEEDWAHEEGVLYTKQMTGCPEGRLPTLESLMSLQLSGHHLKGRILMEKNNVYDADTQNKLTRLTPETFEDIMIDFKKKNLWENSSPEDTLSSEVSLSDNIEGIMKDGSYMKIPKGEYKQKPITHKKSEEGISHFCLCDEPSCCLMSMALISYASTPMIPREMKDDMLNYFKTRPIYQKEDEVNGNIELCRYCLNQAANH